MIFSEDLIRGNPGAYTFMREAIKIDFERAEKGFERMLENGIVGSQLWILYKDCCNFDAELTLWVITEKPIEDIKYHINKEENRGIPYGKK